MEKEEEMRKRERDGDDGAVNERRRKGTNKIRR